MGFIQHTEEACPRLHGYRHLDSIISLYAHGALAREITQIQYGHLGSRYSCQQETVKGLKLLAIRTSFGYDKRDENRTGERCRLLHHRFKRARCTLLIKHEAVAH